MSLSGLLSVVQREPSQGPRRLATLDQGLSFAAISSCIPLNRADLHPPRKVDVKNLAHFTTSKSTEAGWPAGALFQ